MLRSPKFARIGASMSIPMSSPDSATGSARLHGLFAPRTPAERDRRENVVLAQRFVRWVAETTGTDPTTRRRSTEYVKCRMAVALVLRKRGMSYPVIGAALGQDHSTIISAVRRAHLDPTIPPRVEMLERAYQAVTS